MHGTDQIGAMSEEEGVDLYLESLRFLVHREWPDTDRRLSRLNHVGSEDQENDLRETMITAAVLAWDMNCLRLFLEPDRAGRISKRAFSEFRSSLSPSSQREGHLHEFLSLLQSIEPSRLDLHFVASTLYPLISIHDPDPRGSRNTAEAHELIVEIIESLAGCMASLVSEARSAP